MWFQFLLHDGSSLIGLVTLDRAVFWRLIDAEKMLRKPNVYAWSARFNFPRAFQYIPKVMHPYCQKRALDSRMISTETLHRLVMVERPQLAEWLLSSHGRVSVHFEELSSSLRKCIQVVQKDDGPWTFNEFVESYFNSAYASYMSVLVLQSAFPPPPMDTSPQAWKVETPEVKPEAMESPDCMIIEWEKPIPECIDVEEEWEKNLVPKVTLERLDLRKYLNLEPKVKLERLCLPGEVKRETPMEETLCYS